jgi:hypothetical protein
MRKKVKITPFQRASLWALARSGKCSLVSLLDDLQSAFPSDSPRLQIERMERSLGILGRMGCLYFCWIWSSEEKPFTVDDTDRLSLQEVVRWDDVKGRWNFQTLEPAGTEIIVRLTNGGQEVLKLDSEHDTANTFDR